MSTTPEAPGGERTYHDPADTRTPDDVADPTTTRDGTVTTIWQQATENWKLSAIALVLGTLATVLLLYSLRPALIAFATNTIVQYVLGALAIFGLGGAVFAKRERGRIAHQEECLVYYDDHRDPDPWVGSFENRGEDRVFTIYKGTSGLLGGWNPMQASELTSDPRARGQTASILLPEDTHALRLTDRGLKGAVVTSGLEYLPNSDSATLVASLPERTDPGAIRSAKETLAEAKREKDHFEDKLSAQERRIEEIKALAKGGREDAKEDLLDYAVLFNLNNLQRSLSLDQLDQVTSTDLDVQELDAQLDKELDDA
jgi:hypothetical protein